MSIFPNLINPSDKIPGFILIPGGRLTSSLPDIVTPLIYWIDSRQTRNWRSEIRGRGCVIHLTLARPTDGLWNLCLQVKVLLLTLIYYQLSGSPHKLVGHSHGYLNSQSGCLHYREEWKWAGVVMLGHTGWLGGLRAKSNTKVQTSEPPKESGLIWDNFKRLFALKFVHIWLGNLAGTGLGRPAWKNYPG